MFILDSRFRFSLDTTLSIKDTRWKIVVYKHLFKKIISIPVQSWTKVAMSDVQHIQQTSVNFDQNWKIDANFRSDLTLVAS